MARIVTRGPRRVFPKRPVRWVEANSTVSDDEPCLVDEVQILCGADLPGRELVTGLDIAWSDKQEVTLIRLVGDLSVYGAVPQDASHAVWATPTFRFGILVNEDTVPAGVATVDLFDSAVIQDLEWMWLHQVTPELVAKRTGAAFQEEIFLFQFNLHLDLTVKRKLGKADRLYLYRQFAVSSFGVPDGISANMNVLLRQLVMS